MIKGMIKGGNEECIIIIGNGISGVSAADEARKNNNQIRIIIVSDENYLTYYRLRLCELLADDREYNNSLLLHPEEWYRDRNIGVVLGRRATKILPEEKKVLFDNGESVKYTKLIISTGCSSRMPDIPGKDKKGVAGLRTLDDVKKIKENIGSASAACVLGGGLLGLEAAYNLHRKGLNVSVVEVLPRLLTKQLDPKGSSLLENKLESLGINLFCGASVKTVNGGISAQEIVLDNGHCIKANLFLISAGVVSNIDFAGKSGIKVNRGIVVNQKMMTDRPDIYACGDAAEFEGCMPGQWMVSMNQGKVAGINASGGDAEYRYSVLPYFLNTMGIRLYSIEDIGLSGGDYDTLEFSDADNFVYQKLFFLDGHCVGAILMGDVENFNKVNNAVKSRLSKKEVIAEKLVKQ